MAKKFSVRLLPLLLVAIAAFSVACGSAEPAAQVAPTSVPSLSASSAPSETAPSPTNGALGSAGDAPLLPEIEESTVAMETPPNVPDDLRLIWEAWFLLNQDYVDRSVLDPEAFSEQAIRGMLGVLDDPQTSYVSPEVVAGSFGDIFRGEFEGIGAFVDMNRAGKLLIVSPIEGGPAEAAGIKPGDIILEADGESLEGLSLLEAVAKIRGPRGSRVTLLVKHLVAIDPVEITVTRGVIPLVSVRLRSEPGADFAHIRITNFYPNTPDSLKEVVSQVLDDGAKGIILDVRGNSGGTLNSVVDIASMFLEDGLVMYSIRGDGSRTDWRVREGGIAKDIPMVLLVDGGSASSSEVLVGALQDYERATVIGDTTYGKGSVNILRDLSNGGGLYITIAHWFTPLGRLIEDTGIEPDIEVREVRDDREADIKQLERAIEELKLMTGVG